jgi:hypothetical protein
VLGAAAEHRVEPEPEECRDQGEDDDFDDHLRSFSGHLHGADRV